MKRIVVDQGLSAKAAAILRQDGWDAVHVREVGMRDAPDVDILAFAVRESRVVVTLDRDFPQLLALTDAKLPSVVLIRQERLRAPALVALLEAVWKDHERALDEGSVVSVTARSIRTRPLPII